MDSDRGFPEWPAPDDSDAVVPCSRQASRRHRWSCSSTGWAGRLDLADPSLWQLPWRRTARDWRGILSPLPCPNHPHTVVVAIRNVDIPLRVYVTSMWPVQSSSDRWPIVAGTAPASASDGRDRTSHRVNMTYCVVLSVHDQQVAVVVTPDGLRGPPGGSESWPTITTVAT